MSKLRPSAVFLLVGALWVFTGGRPGVLWLLCLTLLAGWGLWSLGARMLTLGYQENSNRRRLWSAPVSSWVKAALLTTVVSSAVLAAVSMVSPSVALAAFGVTVAVGCGFVTRFADPLVIDLDDLDAELAELLSGSDGTL